MSVPTFIGAGDAFTHLTHVTLAEPLPHENTQPGDLLIIHLYHRGNTTTVNLTSVPDGWDLVFGEDAATTTFTTWTLARIADGSALDHPAFETTDLDNGLLRIARMYTFRGTMQTVAAAIEAGVLATATSTSVSAPDVTTLGPDRLAVALVQIADDLAQTEFTGETGGDWVEPVEEFTTTDGADGSMGIQIADMPTAGTITGGTFTITSFRWQVRAFALVPTDEPSGAPVSVLLLGGL
jgi:hypothetical protein